jgi:hypothetical protein
MDIMLIEHIKGSSSPNGTRIQRLTNLSASSIGFVLKMSSKKPIYKGNDLLTVSLCGTAIILLF